MAIVVLLALCVSSSRLDTAASERKGLVGSYRVRSGAISVRCSMTVGGSFEIRTASPIGELHLTSSEQRDVDGSVRVDLAALRTGIDLRDRHLRERYLEVGRGDGFSYAVLSSLRLDLEADPDLAAKGRFAADLLVHGETRRISGEVEIRPTADGVELDVDFPIRISDFGIRRPRHLGVGVRDEVQVEVALRLTRITAASAIGADGAS